jgi:UDP-GlcNAc:undecaprenyl-phosphate GlcNAc-1-phosphate transferase
MFHTVMLKTLLISFVSGVVLVLVILLLTYKYKFGMDNPDSFRIHRKPIPRIGGIALYGAFIIGCLTNSSSLDFFNKQIFGVMFTGTIIVGIGFLDDIFNLKPLFKFVGQLVVVVLAALGFNILMRYVNNPFGEQFEFGYELAVLISVFWLLGTINVTNLLDGVDGLATGMTFIFSLILLLVALMFNQRELSILVIALLGSTLAFLLFNFSPARLFMGDSGSLFLGLMIGELSILAGAKLATVMLILAIPIMDTAYTIVRRLMAGVKFTQRDTNHLHHRMMKAGLSQRQVCLVYFTVAGFFGFVVLIPVTIVKIIAALIASLTYVGLLIFINQSID